MSKRWPLLWLAFYRRRRLVVSLALGLLTFETMIVVITAAVPTNELFNAANVPKAFQAFSGSSGNVSLASVAGLLGAGLLHPFWIALQVSAIASFGAAAVAADVDDGTIELIAVRPISRMRILYERTAAMLLTSLVLSVTAVIPIAVGIAFASSLKNTISNWGVASVVVSEYALMLCFIGIAIAVSCRGRRRSTVLAIVAGCTAVTYAINFVAEAWSPADFLKWISPFHYYRPADALVNGSVAWSNVGVLVAVGLAAFVVGAISLQRRDLTR